jgi:hypothetical protein
MMGGRLITNFTGLSQAEVKMCASSFSFLSRVKKLEALVEELRISVQHVEGF